MLGAALPSPGLASGVAARPAVRGDRGRRWLRRGGSGREGARDAAVLFGVSCWLVVGAERPPPHGRRAARLLAERGLAASRPPPAVAPCPSEVPLVPVLVVGDFSLQVGARRALPAATATGRAASAAAAAACCQQRGRPRLGLRSRLSECLLLGSKQSELGRGGRSFPRARA